MRTSEGGRMEKCIWVPSSNLRLLDEHNLWILNIENEEVCSFLDCMVLTLGPLNGRCLRSWFRKREWRRSSSSSRARRRSLRGVDKLAFLPLLVVDSLLVTTFTIPKWISNFYKFYSSLTFFAHSWFLYFYWEVKFLYFSYFSIQSEIISVFGLNLTRYTRPLSSAASTLISELNICWSEKDDGRPGSVGGERRQNGVCWRRHIPHFQFRIDAKKANLALKSSSRKSFRFIPIFFSPRFPFNDFPLRKLKKIVICWTNTK